ncbi:putative bifunctional diguanylate cyclase/phosphodiesterase [Sphingomonas colocasiae]|uniref:EAL domain-containing protein n=1 Tax=Sphingomonas colocasiae TaxID=1848973 RepID=A0ABS7PW66_9SPHN|nr:EAL domain-containing protein [Sphingomonas colocasiae]MBY8825607.1 EAL domain-containing protein [Sphingomonas colocasiae]
MLQDSVRILGRKRPEPTKEQADTLLFEQYRNLQKQVPFMYALMFINVCFLGFVIYGNVPAGMSVGVPVALIIAMMIRTWFWLRRRRTTPRPDTIRRYLRITVVMAAVLSSMFGGWGLLLFTEADPARSVSVALYIFLGSISCSYCLQALPSAGRLVLLFGAAPVTVRLLMADDPYLSVIGVNFVFVAGFMLWTLSTSYRGFVEVLVSRDEMQAEQLRARLAEQRANELASLDPLTNLPNRRALEERLDRLDAGGAGQSPLGLMMIDLDMFKSVNDVHGHGVGDQLLQETARRLGRLVGASGTAYRLGGDEFAVTIELSGSDYDPVRRAANRIIQEIAMPFTIEGIVHHIGASIGISLFPRDACDRLTLMRRADIALYKAKELGGSQHRAFEQQMDAEIRRRATLEREIRADLKRDAFQPFYQPIVNLVSSEVVGFEMLARWTRADGRLVGPDQFVPIAEECGLIQDLMLKLLDRACLDAGAWDQRLTISVNVSPVQLKDSWFSEKLLAVLARHGFPARRIALEITENALIVEPANAKTTIESLKNQGMLIGLDDFGTGYSSIQHLRMLPFDKIKIDRSFIADFHTNPDSRKMVLAMIGLASNLDMTVIAEGIESADVAERLRSLGCTEGQGYYFGKAMTAAQVDELLGRVSRRGSRQARGT